VPPAAAWNHVWSPPSRSRTRFSASSTLPRILRGGGRVRRGTQPRRNEWKESAKGGESGTRWEGRRNEGTMGARRVRACLGPYTPRQTILASDHIRTSGRFQGSGFRVQGLYLYGWSA
jgi:hypothetical protein